MYKVATIHPNFEAEKNKKAFIYTLIICATLLLLFFFIHWQILPLAPPPPADLIEINLGNNAEGFGEEQPLIKGEMAPAQEPAPQQQNKAAAENTPAQDLQPDDNAEADAAPVIKIEKKVTKPTNVPKENTTKPVKTNNPSPITAPPPPKPQKPKFTYNGPGNGKGNGAAEDKGYQNQGSNKGGKGDAGDPSGKPDSYGNNPGGRSGVSVTRGIRPLNMGSLKFEDDFNQDAKVYVDVKYNAAGGFVSATVVKPTTTTNSTILGITRRKLTELKFPVSAEGGITTILLNFKVQN